MHDPRPLSQQVAAYLASGVGNLKVTVFHGTVTNIETGPTRKRVTFLVEMYWASSVPREVVVETGLNDADCGYPFVEKEDYLVFAGSFKGQAWYTNICNLTTAYGGQLMGYLGPKTEIPGEIPWWVTVGGALSCLSVVAYVLVSRRSKARDATDEEEVRE